MLNIHIINKVFSKSLSIMDNNKISMTTVMYCNVYFRYYISETCFTTVRCSTALMCSTAITCCTTVICSTAVMGRTSVCAALEYLRDQYLVQSSLTFLSMTFLKLIHYQKLQLVQPFMQTMFNSSSVAHLIISSS